MIRSSLLLFACIFGFQVHADILFIDVNNNPLEIRTAQAAAKARGESLIVIPAHDPAAVEKTRQLMQERATLRGQFNGSPPARQREIRARVQAIAREIRAGQVEIDRAALKKTLLEVKASGKPLTSVIVSGHDGNGSFTGANGSLETRELHEALKEVPEVGSQVRSLYLWGCYTATYGACEAHWKQGMPNLGIITGFDDSAPAQDKAANHTYLADALKLEKKLTEARDDKEARALFNRIRNIQTVTASICLRERVINRTEVLNREKVDKMCREVLDGKLNEQWAARIDCYKSGSQGCEDTPSDTRNGEMRQIYTELQRKSVCAEIETDEFQKLRDCWPSKDTALRLTLEKTVRANFQNLHAEDLKHYDELLKAQGYPEEAQLGDITKLSRAQLNRKIALADQETAVRLSEVGAYSDPESIQQLGGIAVQNRNIRTVISDLRKDCVDFDWVEPNAKVQSPCMETSPRDVDKVLANSFRKAVQSNLPEFYDRQENQQRYAAAGTAIKREIEKLKANPEVSNLGFVKILTTPPRVLNNKTPVPPIPGRPRIQRRNR